MLYILHGEDEFTRCEELAKLREKLGDPTVASLNTTLLGGGEVNLTALLQACDAMPFMAERRLVIVQDFWSRLEPSRERRRKDREPKISAADATFIQGLVRYLPRMPDTTRLVFLESRLLGAKNPVFSALPSDKKQVYVKEFQPPAEGSLGRWVERRMKAKGGTITAEAAHELACFIGNNLRQLDQELEKLLAYVNYERPVAVTDVHDVCSVAQVPTVFALVDALGLRRSQRAMEALHKLIDEGESPLGLLSMIQRQFRILLQVKELQTRRVTPSQMQTTLGISRAFIIEKSLRQAHNFDMERLESIYARLAEVEQSIKTGEIGEALALDVLVVELCG